MKPLRYLLFALGLLAASLGLSLAADTATLPGALKDALSPLQGYVVAARRDGYLIDLGSSDGLVGGDLLAVLGQTETFPHPVTGKAIEALPRIDSVLRVTRVEKDIAFGQALATFPPAEVGAPVRRFAGLEADFIDHTGSGESLYLEIRQALPHLEWRPYARIEAAGGARDGKDSTVALRFELETDRLLVRGADAELIRSYDLAGDKGGARPRVAQGAPFRPGPADSGSAYRPEFPRAAPVLGLSGSVRIADLLATDGKLMMAATDGDRIRVHTIGGDGRVSERSAGNNPAGEVVSLHWWQPGHTEKAYLATTSWNGDSALGAVFELRGDRLFALVSRAPYILASFDTNGDGRRETLLGQSFERETFFGSRVRRLMLAGDALVEHGDVFRLPKRFTVQGASFADLTGDGQPELAFVRDHVLHIYSPSGELLYRSPRQIGGSLSWVHYEIDPEFEFSPVNVVPFELAPVPVDLNGDGVKELVTVASELPFLSLPGAGPGVKKSWLAIFQYLDGQFVKGKLGPERDFPVQGLTAAEGEILMVTPTSRSTIGQPDESQIIAVPVEG